MTPAYRNHTVNSQYSRFKGFIHRAALHNCRRRSFARQVFLCNKRLAVKRSAYGVYNPAYKRLTHGHLSHNARALNGAAHAYGIGIIHKHGAHAVLFKVKRHTVNSALKFEQLAVKAVGQALYSYNAVAHA